MSEAKGFHPLTWYREWLPAQKLTPDSPVAKVPCDGCTVCCRHSPSLPLIPGLDNVSSYDTVMVDGMPEFRRQEDGSCIYLINNRCSIYNRRPWICRSFDCRANMVLL